METLHDWFIKQGIDNLWTDDVAESEEALVLLASEKQWNDIADITKELKIPKIKAAYLKAYLIKRTKVVYAHDHDHDTDDRKQNDQDTPSQTVSKALEEEQHKTNKTNKQKQKKTKKSKQKPSPKHNKSKSKKKQNQPSKRKRKKQQKATKKSAIAAAKSSSNDRDTGTENPSDDIHLDYIELQDIQQPQHNTNYAENGFNYKDVPIIEISSQHHHSDFMQYLKKKECCILRGYDVLGTLPDIWTPQYLLNKFRNHSLDAMVSNSQQFREFNMSRNYGKHELDEDAMSKRVEISMLEFVHNKHTKHYYLQSSLEDIADHIGYEVDWAKYLNIVRECEWGSLMHNVLCIGMKGCLVPLKYEQMENVFVQLRGYTEVILFSPMCSPYLYSFPYGHPCYKQSMVNCEYLEENEKEKYFKHFGPWNDVLNDNVYRCVLRKGDVLYIPSFWWHEIAHLNDFTMNVSLCSKPQQSVYKIDIDQILNKKTVQQKIAIGRNLEKEVMKKYGANHDLSTNIFKSFLDHDVKYTKHRNHVRKLLRTVFHENEIDEFVTQWIDGRYNVDCNQFIKRNDKTII